METRGDDEAGGVHVGAGGFVRPPAGGFSRRPKKIADGVSSE